jgi:hypothetical protein
VSISTRTYQLRFAEFFIVDSNTIETAIASYILPLPADAENEAAWVDRFLIVMNSLDHKSRNALLTLTYLSHK